MNCTCPCEFRCKHMYAAIKTIRDKKQFKYYKVRYVEQNVDTFNKIISNNYYLCIGYYKDTLTLVYPSGEIVNVHFLDANGKSMFEVVEDDENNTLTNYINEFKR